MKLFPLALAAALLAAPTKEIPTVAPPQSVAAVSHRDTRTENFYFNDPWLVCPTLAQLQDILKFCAKNRTNQYQTNLFDCEDHAREFHVFASRWALKNYSGLPAGLAVGTAIVRIVGNVDGLGDYGPDTLLHAMTVIVLADGRLVLIEPRTSKYIFPLSAVYEGLIEFQSIEM